MLDLANYLFEALVCATLVGLACAIFVLRAELIRSRYLIRRERDERRALANDLAALLSCSQNIGSRLREHDLKQHQVVKKLGAIDDSSDNVPAPIYERVYKLVNQGLAIDQIADICGLGRGEVELLARIAEHRAAA